MSLTETYTVQRDLLTVLALVEAQNQILTCKQVWTASATCECRNLFEMFVATQVGFQTNKLDASLFSITTQQFGEVGRLHNKTGLLTKQPLTCVHQHFAVFTSCDQVLAFP